VSVSAKTSRKSVVPEVLAVSSTASTAWTVAPSQKASASSSQGSARGCWQDGARWALSSVRCGPWVTSTRVEAGPGAITTSIEGDMVVLLVARDDRGGKCRECGRRAHDRGDGPRGLTVIRYFLRGRPAAGAVAGLSRGAEAMGPARLGVAAIGLAVARRVRAVTTRACAVAVATVAAGAEREERATVAGFARQKAEGEREIDVGHRRRGAARRKVDEPERACDDTNVVSRHRRDRPKAREVNAPGPSCFVRPATALSSPGLAGGSQFSTGTPPNHADWECCLQSTARPTAPP